MAGEESEMDGAASQRPSSASPLQAAPVGQGKVMLMAGERELTTGLFGEGCQFLLARDGQIGVKEIERAD